ncbi:MAG: thioredoxin domain-containing protein [bacterium]
MPRIASLRRLGAIVLLAAGGACSRTDAAPVSQQVSASGGDVSATAVSHAGAAPMDSISSLADRGRIRGAASAPIWLVEISDFQCPYCKRWHDESFAALDKEYVQAGKVRLAYLNFPIPSLHANARAASETAMCASVQGKFWVLHESLFNTQAKWAAQANPMPTFDSLATVAGVDAARWRSCMATHATIALIDADQQRSKANGVQSTPTFYVGDERLEGAYPVDSFRVAIDRQLAKARGGR